MIKQQGSGFAIGTPVRGALGPANNGLHQTGRGGAAGLLRRRPVVEARPAGEPGCSTAIDVETLTAVGASKTIYNLVGCTKILVGSASNNMRGGYGAALAVAPSSPVRAMGMPWSGSIGFQATRSGRERPAAEFETLGTTTERPNKELERTRSTHFVVSPRRSIQC